jgi:opacity protein-like surface antigen
MRRTMFLMLLLAVWVVGAFAQTGELSVSAGKSTFRNNTVASFTDSTTGQTVTATVDSNFRLGFRFTINSWRFFGHEIGYAYNHGSLKEGSTSLGLPVHQGMYNFLAYATPEGTHIRPFVTGGVHFSTFFPPGSSVFSGNGFTKFGINYGGGVKVRLSSLLMGRVDIRDYLTGKPDFFQVNPGGKLHQLEISAGLGVAF